MNFTFVSSSHFASITQFAEWLHLYLRLIRSLPCPHRQIKNVYLCS
nr:MAG TPA: hypothetical protein [Caudoviricetes sp.]